MYVYCVESFAHIACYSDCSCRGAIWLNPFASVPLSVSLLGFGMGAMLTNFHMCGIVLVFRAVFNMLVRNASPRRPMCFR